jgi:AmiR/NasT family two-component response regulator
MLPLKTVVVADDELAVREFLRTALSSLGYTVMGTAKNGQEAIDLVQQYKPQLAILDIHMPGLDGMEATKAIVALEHTAVVLLTLDQSMDLVRQALDLGASGYMQKPFTMHQIGIGLEVSWHRYETKKAMQAETKALQESLELRKLTEKAKGILMQQQGFSEEEAHRCIQKMSQDQGLPLKDVCESIIRVRAVLGASKRSVSQSFHPR